ncbi:MAG: creatininase family protein [Bacteroidales bacterium]|nr:creatininase family protein [Bacteroidales bacterium]
MKTLNSLLTMVSLLLVSFQSQGQEIHELNLSFHYGELTAPDFIQAVEKSKGTCIIPAGIMEKHGAHLPLGTDLFLAREVSSRAASEEYTIVFPEYYFGQIFEAMHQPGTIAYSPELIWKMLEETCNELSRNGIKKIVIVNGHGGNTHFFSYFCQAQLAARKDYVVVLFSPDDNETNQQIRKMRTTNYGGHADEVETSMVHSIRPDLVHAERAPSQSGKDQARLDHLSNAYTGIWWYASYPNHYAGDGSSPQKTIGEIKFDNRAEQLARLIKELKDDESISNLQNRFYGESEDPLKTKQ